MRGKLFATVLFLLIGIAVAVAISFLISQKRSPGLATQTLSDGTQVIIQAITFGTNHVFTHGSPFLARLKNHVPPRFHKWLGTQHTTRSTMPEPTAIIWFSGFNATTQQYTYLNPDGFRIIDDHGCVLQINQYGGGMADPSFTLQHACANTFPFRQKHFTFRARFAGQPPVEFKVPNPAYPAKITEWTPEPLPATRTLGATNFTLTRIRGRFHTDGSWFEPRLQIDIAGEDRTKWFKPQFKYRDATGNFAYSLCPYEPAWKVECEVYHSYDAPFLENEILRIPDLAVPKPGEVIPLSQFKTLGNVSLQFVALCGPGEYKFSNGVCIAAAPYDKTMSGETYSSSSSSGPPRRVELSFRRKDSSLVVDINGLDDSSDLLLRGRDDSGKLFRVSFNGSADRTYRYGLEAPTNTTRFALELIPQQPIRLAYTVSPPRPEK